MTVYMTTKINRKTGEVTYLDPIEVDDEKFYRWAQPFFKFIIDKFVREEVET